MQRNIATFVFALFTFIFTSSLRADPIETRSPNGHVAIAFDVVDGDLTYSVSYRGKPAIGQSNLGMTFQTGGPLRGLRVTDVKTESHDETYSIIAGKSSEGRDRFNAATISLAAKDGRKIDLLFRAYDDGAAFQYHIPKQDGLSDFVLTSEDSTFSLPADARAWMLPIPKFANHYEYRYEPKKVSELPKEQLIGLPLLLELPNQGGAIAITEANLNDYAGMYLAAPKDAAASVLQTRLAPLPGQDAIKVRATAPHDSPWRAIMLGDSTGALIESNLVMNLNDPCAIKDTSWIKPGKVAFLWWNGYLVAKNGKRGGVNTATFNHYVDAAAEFGLPYSSIDGLDIAWYGGKIPGYGENDITVPVKELDMPAVLAHAKEKGVRIRLWVASAGMQKYLDKALETYEKWGVEGVMVDFIERDDQNMHQWIRELVSKAADHHLTVTLHNCPKPTGLSRTYPNLLTFEAVLNQEYNKWDRIGSTPEHQLTVPFTRMLAGPLDFHTGGFRSIRQADYLPRDTAPDVMGTRCQQLAMYLIYDDPMPMAVDYPAAYRGRPGMDFLSAVPTTWDETRVIDGVVSDYLTIARRKGADWYVGSMTDNTSRDLKLPLTFLKDGTFTAEVWSDDVENGPNAVKNEKKMVTSSDTLTLKLASAGGQVIRFRRTK